MGTLKGERWLLHGAQTGGRQEARTAGVSPALPARPRNVQRKPKAATAPTAPLPGPKSPFLLSSATYSWRHWGLGPYFSPPTRKAPCGYLSRP